MANVIKANHTNNVQYMLDLSSKLRDSSNTKKLLKEKIENLRLALKRPNEILVKHQNLTKQAIRDEKLLKKFAVDSL